ncbi:MAG: hypothetical protein AAF399_17925 [Bacteroidota bacterium]
MKSLTLMLFSLLAIHLPLSAQLFIADTPFLSGVSYVPHVFSPVQQHLEVQLTPYCLKRKGSSYPW